jgi:tetratricopeptide (TPR) repeat protein
MSAPAASAAPAPASSRWLFGPAPDLLLGCGLGYALLLAGICATGSLVREALPLSLLAFLTLIFGTPHYGATLLRVYERREDRRGYALFAIWATAALAVLFVAGTRSARLGSWILTVYLTWSPWHYTGQNYGLSVMFLRRRGVAVDPPAKRLLYGSFWLSFLLTFLAMHQQRPSAPYAPTLYSGYEMIPLGIPTAIASIALPVLAVAYLATLVGAAVLLLRRGRPRDLGPAALLVLTQALWFSIPVVARAWHVGSVLEPLSAQYATYYFFYAALGHSIQYCWVTSYFARKSQGYTRVVPFLTKALLAGAVIWTVPALLFAPNRLGRVPFDAGLGALVASVVNLHHFVLDGAIWKLRDSRIARVLLRSEGARPAAPAPRRRLGVAPIVWAMGVGSLAVTGVASFETEFGLRRAFARGDAVRMQHAISRLDALGRESAYADLELGQLLQSHGDLRGALRAYAGSIGVQPTAAAWSAVADVYENSEAILAADAAATKALELAPDSPELAYRSGQLALRRHDVERARRLFERAARLDPESKLYRLAVDRAAGANAPAP